MGNVYGTQATKYTTVPWTAIPAGDVKGKVRCIRDDFTFAGEASGTILYVGPPIPKGARWCAISYMVNAALGTSVTLKVGHDGGATGDDAKFLAATACSSAGANFLNVIGGVGYAFTRDARIIVTTGGAAATGKVVIEAYYTME